ncbi:hypothetical protein MATL_G00086480 [Megalops atlanticus]|uniref:Uncharacterized protein n=1 Tax=Megalops atlanticus TaxID=7932 RepID=A0A9D3Q2T3_MEGAT|nr:hypothetical protein MATL_G00086480 [Megalops atlanticus]
MEFTMDAFFFQSPHPISTPPASSSQYAARCLRSNESSLCLLVLGWSLCGENVSPSRSGSFHQAGTWFLNSLHVNICMYCVCVCSLFTLLKLISNEHGRNLCAIWAFIFLWFCTLVSIL